MALAGSTTYDVRVDYKLEDRASAGLKSIGRQADKTGDSLGALKGIMVAVGGGFLLHEAKKAFIDFNSEIEMSKIQLSAIVQMNLGGTFSAAQSQAEGLFNEFQRFSKLTPVTTKDIMEFGTAISAAVFGAGGGIKEFTNISEQGVIAAKVFGANAQYASMEMTEMLQGNVTNRMRFARQLLAAVGTTEEAFRRLSAKGRLDLLTKALNSTAMKNATDAFAGSFAGVTSTLKDNIQIALGKVGIPLFKAVTAEIKSWNVWIEKHPKEIEEFAHNLSNGLVTAFSYMKEIMGFLVSHKDTLLMLGAAWGISKVGTGLFGAAQGMGAGGTAALMMRGAALGFASSQFNKLGQGFEGWDKANTAVTTVTGAFAGLPGPLGAVTKGLLGLEIAAGALASYYDGQLSKKNAAQTNLAFVTDRAGRFAGDLHTQQALRNTLAGGGQWDAHQAIRDREKMRSDAFDLLTFAAKDVGAMSRVGTGQETTAPLNMRMLDEYLRTKGGLGGTTNLARERIESSIEMAHNLLAEDHEFRARVLFGGLFGDAAKPEEVAAKPPMNVNVTIERIEVTSQDPDRFVFDMINAFEDVAAAPTQAHRTVRAIGG